MTIGRFVIVRHGVTLTARFLNHEEIHVRQQMETLVAPFIVWYGLEFIFRLVQYRNWIKAYKNISFEREAYANERNLSYLPQRKTWAFMKYMRK